MTFRSSRKIFLVCKTGKRLLKLFSFQRGKERTYKLFFFFFLKGPRKEKSVPRVKKIITSVVKMRKVLGSFWTINCAASIVETLASFPSLFLITGYHALHFYTILTISEDVISI